MESKSWCCAHGVSIKWAGGAIRNLGRIQIGQLAGSHCSALGGRGGEGSKNVSSSQNVIQINSSSKSTTFKLKTGVRSMSNLMAETYKRVD